MSRYCVFGLNERLQHAHKVCQNTLRALRLS